MFVALFFVFCFAVFVSGLVLVGLSIRFHWQERKAKKRQQLSTDVHRPVAGDA